MLKKELQNAMAQNRMVSVYSNTEDSGSFSVGTIQKIDEDNFILASINELGDYDGYICKKINDVFLIESDSKYLHKISRLRKYKTREHDDIGNADDGVAKQLFQFAKDKGLVINVQLVDSGYNDVQGLVEKVEDSVVEVSVFDGYGESDGKVVFEFDNITYIICDSDKEETVRKLIDR